VNGPIFVVGASRSGKTLMRWMLTSHPNIAVTRRTEMWPRFYGRFGDLAVAANFDGCVRAMLARKQIASLEPDMTQLRRDFAGGPQTYERLFALLHEQVAQREGKPRWGDQSALVDRYADRVISAYEGVRVIHLVRDPRDRYEAIVATRARDARGPRRPALLVRSTLAWRKSAHLALRNVQRHPGSYAVVRYETLVRKPEPTLRELCDFLGERYEPAMSRMDCARRYDQQRVSAPDGSPVSTAYVGRGADRLPPRELACIERMTRPRSDALARVERRSRVLSPGERRADDEAVPS
jgi:Sulfotransferase family